MADSEETRRERFRRIFRRGPIVSFTFDLDDFFLTTTEDDRASLADRIERTGHALIARDLSRLLNVSEVTIFKHAKAGRIPSFRIGTSVRFDPKSLAEWLRKQ